MANSYGKHFSESAFWDKCKTVFKAAGREVIEKALWLYYAMMRPETPSWAKATIVGALGYFILPIDIVPDFIPIVGYADDLSALAGAIKLVYDYIDDDVKASATKMMQKWGMA